MNCNYVLKHLIQIQELNFKRLKTSSSLPDVCVEGATVAVGEAEAKSMRGNHFRFNCSTVLIQYRTMLSLHLKIRKWSMLWSNVHVSIYIN